MTAFLKVVFDVLFFISVIVAIPFFVSYFKHLGANKAMQQNIDKIVDISEKVKSNYERQLKLIEFQNEMFLENIKSRNLLSMAALDRRLEVHQRAYSLWWKLAHAVHKPEDMVGPIVAECQDWWVNNNIFLDANSREAFWMAIMCALDHRRLNESKEIQLIHKNWEKIQKAGELIVKGVQLPAIDADILFPENKE